MNCFPCKGPACNSCKKFDRINDTVRRNSKATCKHCGTKVSLAENVCPNCGREVVTPPGHAIE